VFSLSALDYPFDYENRSLYSVEIDCHLSDPSRSGRGSVDARIGPVNEYRPVLKVPPFILVNETTPIGSVIAAPSSGPAADYSSSDGDDGADGVITYSLTGGDDSFFQLDADGTITLTADPNIDNIPTGTLALSISIVACNEGIELDLCETQHLPIFITPVNDLPPVFTDTEYKANLTESELNGTFVVQVRCVDEDKGGVGGVQSISFASGTSNETLSTFQVEYDAESGSADVSLNGELDYDMTPSYSFSLVCSDGLYTATSRVVVEVLPVNDHLPRFEHEEYKFSVNRADPLPSDTIIGTVKATDSDVQVGGTVSYSLDHGSKFTIDSESGEISLKDYLSVGDGRTFDFEVVASDGAHEARASVRVTATGLLSVLEWVYVGIGGTVLLVILTIIGIFVFHHFIKAASLRTVVEKYREPEKESVSEEPDIYPTPMFLAPPPPHMFPPHDRGMSMVGQPLYPTLDDEDELSERSGTLGTGEGSQYPGPGPLLQEVVDYFHEGDKMLDKKGSKK
jgi:hypothetical protein